MFLSSLSFLLFLGSQTGCVAVHETQTETIVLLSLPLLKSSREQQWKRRERESVEHETRKVSLRLQLLMAA